MQLLVLVFVFVYVYEICLSNFAIASAPLNAFTQKLL